MSPAPPEPWRLLVERTPAAVIAAMPAPMAGEIGNFLRALVLEVGFAVDAGKPPAGDLLDAANERYGLQIHGEPVLLEYTLRRAERQILISVVVWVHF